jgi:hypothetical protein
MTGIFGGDDEEKKDKDKPWFVINLGGNKKQKKEQKGKEKKKKQGKPVNVPATQKQPAAQPMQQKVQQQAQKPVQQPAPKPEFRDSDKSKFSDSISRLHGEIESFRGVVYNQDERINELAERLGSVRFTISELEAAERNIHGKKTAKDAALQRDLATEVASLRSIIDRTRMETSGSVSGLNLLRKRLDALEKSQVKYQPTEELSRKYEAVEQMAEKVLTEHEQMEKKVELLERSMLSAISGGEMPEPEPEEQLPPSMIPRPFVPRPEVPFKVEERHEPHGILSVFSRRHEKVAPSPSSKETSQSFALRADLEEMYDALAEIIGRTEKLEKEGRIAVPIASSGELGRLKKEAESLDKRVYDLEKELLEESRKRSTESATLRKRMEDIELSLGTRVAKVEHHAESHIKEHHSARPQSQLRPTTVVPDAIHETIRTIQLSGGPVPAFRPRPVLVSPTRFARTEKKAEQEIESPGYFSVDQRKFEPPELAAEEDKSVEERRMKLIEIVSEAEHCTVKSDYDMAKALYDHAMNLYKGLLGEADKKELHRIFLRLDQLSRTLGRAFGRDVRFF